MQFVQSLPRQIRKFSQIFRLFLFNVNSFKWVPTLKSGVTYDLDTRHRHHNDTTMTPTPQAQNYWRSGEPPLPRYACIYHRYIYI